MAGAWNAPPQSTTAATYAVVPCATPREMGATAARRREAALLMALAVVVAPFDEKRLSARKAQNDE